MSEIELLKAQIAELMVFKRSIESERTAHPLSKPISDIGLGSTALTQSIALSGSPQSIDVPAAYSDTVILKIGDTDYEVPFLKKSPNV